MTDIDLTALRAKAEAATSGPWRVETDTTLVWGRCDPEDFTTYGMGIPLTEVRIGQQQLKGPSLSCDEAEATAQFIAAANPTTVLALLDRVEKAEADLRELSELSVNTYTSKSLEIARLRAGLNSIVNCQSHITRSYIREAAAEVLGGNTSSICDQSPFVERNANLRALLARAGEALRPFLRAAGNSPKRGEPSSIHGTFNVKAFDAARTIASEIEESIGHE